MKTAVLTLLALAPLVAGCGGPPAASKEAEAASKEAERVKAAVLRVLRADRELGRKVESLPPNPTPPQLAWAIGEYCASMERLDTSDCPPDFRVAYRHHTGAWREAQAAVKQLPDGFLDGVFTGAVNALTRGERDGGLSRLEGGVRRALERVRDTWIEVEKIGARYGAAL